MMCGGSFCVWSILVAAAFLVSGLALSVFASQIHLSQRERPWQKDEGCVECQGLPLWGELANPQDLTERARLLPLCDVPFSLSIPAVCAIMTTFGEKVSSLRWRKTKTGERKDSF